MTENRSYRAFKYIKPEDAHFLRNETVLLGTFAHFAELEILDDPEEGQLSYSGRINVSNGADPRSHEAIDNAGRHGVRVAKSRHVNNVSINITSVAHAAPCAILCLSRSATNAHLLSKGLTCVWEIPDVRELADYIWQSYPALFNEGIASVVSYEPKQVPLASRASPSPFVKDPYFSPEDEYRIVWPTRVPFEKLSVPLGLSRTRLVRRVL